MAINFMDILSVPCGISGWGMSRFMLVCEKERVEGEENSLWENESLRGNEQKKDSEIFLCIFG